MEIAAAKRQPAQFPPGFGFRIASIQPLSTDRSYLGDESLTVKVENADNEKSPPLHREK
jgi:hypothetical protein